MLLSVVVTSLLIVSGRVAGQDVNPCSTSTDLGSNVNRYSSYYGDATFCDTVVITVFGSWYHFSHAVISDFCVRQGRCSTYNTLWVNSSLPMDDKPKLVQLCANYKTCCGWQSHILVQRCPEANSPLKYFYTYKIEALPPEMCSGFCIDDCPTGQVRISGICTVTNTTAISTSITKKRSPSKDTSASIFPNQFTTVPTTATATKILTPKRSTITSIMPSATTLPSKITFNVPQNTTIQTTTNSVNTTLTTAAATSTTLPVTTLTPSTSTSSTATVKTFYFDITATYSTIIHNSAAITPALFSTNKIMAAIATTLLSETSSTNVTTLIVSVTVVLSVFFFIILIACIWKRKLYRRCSCLLCLLPAPACLQNHEELVASPEPIPLHQNVQNERIALTINGSQPIQRPQNNQGDYTAGNMNCPQTIPQHQNQEDRIASYIKSLSAAYTTTST